MKHYLQSDCSQVILQPHFKTKIIILVDLKLFRKRSYSLKSQGFCARLGVIHHDLCKRQIWKICYSCDVTVKASLEKVKLKKSRLFFVKTSYCVIYVSLSITLTSIYLSNFKLLIFSRRFL